MQFYVSWTIKPEHRDRAQDRFKQTGGMPPEGVKMLGRWHSTAGLEGFLICEADDAIALGKWTQAWSDVLSFRVVPVNDDAGALEVMG